MNFLYDAAHRQGLGKALLDQPQGRTTRQVQHSIVTVYIRTYVRTYIHTYHYYNSVKMEEWSLQGRKKRSDVEGRTEDPEGRKIGSGAEVCERGRKGERKECSKKRRGERRDHGALEEEDMEEGSV